MRPVKWTLVGLVVAVAALWGGWSQFQPAGHGLPYLMAADASPVQRAAGGPDLLRLPDVTLRDQRERPASLARLQGRPVIVDFTLAGCEDVCPPKRVALKKLLQAQSRRDLTVVSLVMNRQRVAPGILVHLVAETGVPEGRWQYWQGNDGDVLRYCQRIPLVGPRIDRTGKEPGARHSDNVLLLDAAGYCRGVYHANSALDMKHLAEDLALLPARSTPT